MQTNKLKVLCDFFLHLCFYYREVKSLRTNMGELSEDLCFTIDLGTRARRNDGLLSSRQQLSAVLNWKGRPEQRKEKQLSHWERKQ